MILECSFWLDMHYLIVAERYIKFSKYVFAEQKMLSYFKYYMVKSYSLNSKCSQTNQQHVV